MAVSRGDSITEVFLDEQRVHAKRLLGLIQECLEKSGLEKKSLDAVVWGRGPGSFTGLRIAAACVQGLSFGLQIPAVGVSSLLALALRARHVNPEPQQRVWVGMDAKMGEIYSASFLMDFAEQKFSYIEEEKLLSSENLEIPTGYDTYLGSALGLGDVNALSQHVFVDEQVHASDMLRLPANQLSGSTKARDTEPVYLRKADAWKKMGVS